MLRIENVIVLQLINLLTPWSRVLLEKMIVPHFIKKFSCFLWNLKVHYCIYMNPPHLSILKQTIPVYAPPHPPTQQILLKIYFNILLPSMPGFSKWSLSLNFPHQNPYVPYPLPHMCYIAIFLCCYIAVLLYCYIDTCPVCLISLNFITQAIFGADYRS